MNSLIYKGHDTERYMPRHFSDDKKEILFNFMLGCVGAVQEKKPIGVYYNGIPRIMDPYSAFLQKRTPNSTSEIINPSNILTKMRFQSRWARWAIAMDVDQILSTSKNSRNGWKTLHLDKVDDLRLMTLEEMWKVFLLENNQIADGIHLTEWFTPTTDFVGNWNYWFRIFLAQIESQYDLKASNR